MRMDDYEEAWNLSDASNSVPAFFTIDHAIPDQDDARIFEHVLGDLEIKTVLPSVSRADARPLRRRRKTRREKMNILRRWLKSLFLPALKCVAPLNR